jgi:hypothetical protein
MFFSNYQAEPYSHMYIHLHNLMSCRSLVLVVLYLNAPCEWLIMGAVVAVNVWQLYLQLPLKSVHITTDVVSSDLDQGEVYNIMW